jgi:hypothetical protein
MLGASLLQYVDIAPAFLNILMVGVVILAHMVDRKEKKSCCSSMLEVSLLDLRLICCLRVQQLCKWFTYFDRMHMTYE